MKDEQSIVDLYNANGFRHVKVTSRLATNYRGNASQIAVIFSVTKGPQWRISRFEVSGLEHVGGARLAAVLNAGRGQPYSELAIAEDRSVILTVCSSNGFRQATFHFTTTPTGADWNRFRKYRSGPPRRSR